MIFEYVRQRRKELMLTQKEVVKRAGFSLYVIRRFESTRPYNPDVIQLSRLAKALGVKGNFLLMECEWPE